MTIGTRIKELRQKCNYSQEYVAVQLDVSRQAVSKWENDITAPDTNNLIMLAQLFDSTVEYIANGKEPENKVVYVVKERQRKKRTKKQKIIIAVSSVMSFFTALVITGVILIYSWGVDFDAGGCSSGFKTSVFDMYNEELVEKFYQGADDKDKISDIKAIKGTHDATWEKNSIHLTFDIQYEYEDEGTVTQTLTFIGKRRWINVYDWGGAIIVG